MIITRTPYRISFFGGGTDYPVWFMQHGGAVLATTIDKYCYISCRYLPPFFEHRSKIVYSRIETVSSNHDIEHPAVRGVLQYLGVDAGVEIHHDGDLPARTGLGSSSAFTVGLVQGMSALLGVAPSTKMELARQAIDVEQQLLKEHVGCQDQVLAAFGGLVRVDFATDATIRVNPIPVSPERSAEFQRYLMLVFTGLARTASDVAAKQVALTPALESELGTIRQMVDEAQMTLCGTGPIEELGRLLHESWRIKRSLTSKISTSVVDEIYATARRAGAIGGKLLGAGGGGFMVLFARPEEQPRIRRALDRLLIVPFAFESEGSQIILHHPDRAPLKCG